MSSAMAFRRNASTGRNAPRRTRHAFRRNATFHNDRMHSVGMQGRPDTCFLPIGNPYGIASGYAPPMTGADAAFRRNASIGRNAPRRTRHAFRRNATSHNDRMHSYRMQGRPGTCFLPIDNPYGMVGALHATPPTIQFPEHSFYAFP
jgi:hypothetical protein